MSPKLLSLLGLARRAGKLEPGFDAAVLAAREKKALLLLAAEDISEKTFKNLRYEGEKAGVPVQRVPVNIQTLGSACGVRAGILAVTDEGFVKAILGLCKEEKAEEVGKREKEDTL